MDDLRQQETICPEKHPGLQISGVGTVFEKLAQNRTLSDVLDALCLTIEKMRDEIICSILLIDKETGRLSHGAAPSLPDFYLKAVNGTPVGMGVGSCGEAAFTAKRVIVEDILIHPNWKNFTSIAVDKAGLRACWSEPVIGSDSKVLGTFAIYYRQPQSPTKEDIELIRGAAYITSIAIEYSMNREQLKQANAELEHRVIERTKELRLRITEKEQAEIALRKSHEALSESQRIAKLGSWDLDLNTQIITLSVEHQFVAGRECKEAALPLDEYIADYVAEKDIAIIQDQLAFAVQNIENSSYHNNFEYCLKTDGDGGYKNIAVQIRFKSKGIINGVIQDITERKKTKAALREGVEKYRNLFNNAQVGMFRSGMDDGKFFEANDALARMFGYEDRVDILDAEYIAGDNYVDPGTRETLLAIIREHGEFRNFEARLYRKDRSVAWFRYSGRIFPEKGYIEGVIADITEEKRMKERLLQAHKMESIGTLAGGIAHDFNNMLGIIVGNTELAMDDVPEWNPARNNLNEIRTASLRARDVVKQILAFSRLSLQEMKPVRISPIIKDSLKLLRSSIPTTIEIHQNISGEPDTVRGDPTQIHQILINLCTNAAHAMGEKGGVLAVSLKNIEIDEGSGIHHHDLSPGKYIRLTVSDTGHGIEPKFLERIFDPYFTTKGVGEGSGMGLSVVHGIIKSYSGDISVSSEPGKGTTFQVFFPFIESQSGPEIEIGVEIPRGTERILFIDDEKAMVDTIQPMIERLGYKVIARTSSIEALEAFRANPDRFDLVITDFTMPNMTGMELAKELLKLRSDILIILCTGYSEHINEEKAKGNGIRAFIMKPVVLNEISNTIRKVLDDH
jgi:PAS domain S-box-containing protein